MKPQNLLLLVTASAVLQGAQPAIEVKTSTPSGVVIEMSLPSADFREDALRPLSERILGQFPRSRFVTADIVVANGPTTPRVSHLGYAYYRSAALWAQSNIYRALLIAIDHNAVLLISRPNEKMQRVTIRGVDPTGLSDRSCSAEILYIGANSEHETVVYLQSDQQQDYAKCHQSAVSAVGGSNPIHSRIRQDPWFFGVGTSYPVVYLFTTKTVPTYEEWRTTPMIECEGRAAPVCKASQPNMRE